MADTDLGLRKRLGSSKNYGLVEGEEGTWEGMSSDRIVDVFRRQLLAGKLKLKIWNIN